MRTSELLVFCFVISLMTFALGYHMSFQVAPICLL
jgi:hypothetical protein